MSVLQNYTYNEITIGQCASYSKTLHENDLVLFAAVSGDINPLHLDAEYAATTAFKERIGHGAWTGSIISAALALELPGPGTIFTKQTLSFRTPVKIGDTVTIKLEVINKKDKMKLVTLNCKAINQHGKLVAKGSIDVIAPSEKLTLPKPTLPDIKIG
ncbi:MAG: MaoC family dehydratase N-terminal domain-containing protein [Spongiibacteraceae bacterium]|nr:MaoC family dehydratase N-terminal domain-containing protein [Spongiibacteraceae bacterium]